MIFPCHLERQAALILKSLTCPQPQLTTTTIPSSMFDPQESDELPPPAYELTQESFDQKTQHGIELSLEPQDPLHDLWEDWDDAKFEANLQSIANPSAPSSSSAQRIPPLAAHEYPKEKVPRPASPPPPQQEEPAVRPLKIVKKSQTAALKKAAEARSYQSNDFSADPTSANGGASLSRNFSMMSMGRRTPPPAFESNGPSYDGPEYEEMMMSYGYASGNARPESPGSILSADSYHSPALPPQQQMGNSRPNTNTALPPPPNPPIQYKPAPRPTQTQTQRPPFRPPGRLVGFDHMSAYKSKSAFTPGLESTPEKVDPSAFYKCVHSSSTASKSSVTDS